MNKYKKYLDKLASLENKIIIVTGANSGIGLQTCFHLAYKKAHIIMACRNVEKANKAKQAVLKEYPETIIDVLNYDQSSFESIESFSNAVKTKYLKIDGLVCNAGVYYPKKNSMTKDGYELTIGTNYLGVYKLINSLKDLLNNSYARVVIVTSLTGFLSVRSSLRNGLKMHKNKVYGFSKYCLSRLCNELDSENSNITYNLTHPGISQTNIISSDQTGLPNWFSKLGHGFLYLFVHHADKASLTNILGLVNDSDDKKYITPRGLFNISGYPKKRKYPNYSKKKIIEETNSILKVGR